MPEPREITMGAYTGGLAPLEYRLFSEWYKKTYNQPPPPNGAALLANSIYGWWKQNLRSKVWSPQQETQATAEQFKQAGQPASWTGIPTPPQLPVVTPPDEWDKMKANALRISQETGIPYAEVYAQLSGLTIPREDTGQLTAWQRAQLDLQAQQINRADWAAAQNRMAAQTQFASQRMANLAMGGGRFDETIRKQAQFEEMRDRLLQAIPPTERNQFKLWDVQNMENPFTSALRTSAIEEAQFAKEDKIYWDKIAKGKAKEIATSIAEMPSHFRDEWGQKSPESSIAWSNVMDLMESQRLAEGYGGEAERNYQKIATSPQYKEDVFYATPRPLEGGEAGAMVVGRGETEPRRPTTPPTPEWLPQFVPELKGQANLAKFAIPTPSPQQWSATPWSQREGLFGYMDWAGKQKPVEVMEQMASMLPQAPSLGKSWQAARRWA